MQRRIAIYRPRFAALSILFLVGVVVGGCVIPRASQKVEGARVALEAARAAGAPERSPEEFNEAMKALQDSESYFARGDAFSLDTAEKLGELAESKALSATATATAKLSTDAQKAQAEARVAKQEAEQARADVARLQPQLRASEEKARVAQTRAEQAEAQMSEARRQATTSSQPTAPLPSYVRYVVKRGDTLPTIAARPEIYGDAGQWKRIYDANQDIIGRDRKLNMGQVLVIPKP